MDKLYVNADGELVAEVNGQPVRFAKPHAYQNVAGSAKAVSVEYALAGQDKAHLQIGDYDKNLELVIDPILSYSTYLGGRRATPQTESRWTQAAMPISRGKPVRPAIPGR